MSSIENLRKQAKRILRWHREGHYPVAEFIRTHLSIYGQMSDQEILSQPFRLADAHLLVARQRGFSSWQELLKGESEMTQPEKSSNQKATFIRAEPQLLVTDIARSLDYFHRKLGFGTALTYGEPPFYAQVHRGGCHLNLRLIPEPVIDPSTLEKESFLAATLCVKGIKTLFLEYQASEADFRQTLRTEPWGARTFIVADPDGNLILFAE